MSGLSSSSSYRGNIRSDPSHMDSGYTRRRIGGLMDEVDGHDDEFIDTYGNEPVDKKWNSVEKTNEQRFDIQQTSGYANDLVKSSSPSHFQVKNQTQLLRARAPSRLTGSPTLSHGHSSRFSTSAPPAEEQLDLNSLTIMEEVLLLGLHDQKGYLSLMNDSISYVLRGCMIMELAFRGRIRTVEELPLKNPAERHLEVVDGRITGDVLLDEALKFIKSEKHSIAGWIDLLSGETWNPLKIGYQLRQVRERIAKGLVDKGILRTEKKTFFLFDMPTHPLANTSAKHDLSKKILDCLLGMGGGGGGGTTLSDVNPKYQSDIRLIALIVSAFAANVLDRVLRHLSYQQRELALSKAEQWMSLYSNEEVAGNDIIAAVLIVFSRMDSLVL